MAKKPQKYTFRLDNVTNPDLTKALRIRPKEIWPIRLDCLYTGIIPFRFRILLHPRTGHLNNVRRNVDLSRWEDFVTESTPLSL